MSTKALWLIPKTIHMEPVVTTLPGKVHNYVYNYLSDGSIPPDLMHLGIVDTAETVKPDLIIFVGIAEGPYFVGSHIFKKLKAPIIHICCDAACPGWRDGIEYYFREKCFSMTVNIDGNDNWLKGPKDKTLWCPLDPSFYKPLPKTKRLSWAGGLGPERQRLINELKDVIEVMPRNEVYGSYQQYADFLSASKMTLNMAKSGSGLALQTKNRVREAGYAKCLLLEERGSPTSNWFTLGEDYLDYGSAGEVRSIVNSLEDSEISEIATRFQKKVFELYSPHLFWDKVLSSL